MTFLTDSMPCTKYKSEVEFLQESDEELCSKVNEISNDVAYLSCGKGEKNVNGGARVKKAENR